MNQFHLPAMQLHTTQNINLAEKAKPLETIIIHVENRQWNIEAINELFGFGEQDQDLMSNFEIAILLQAQAQFEFRRDEHLLDCRKRFLLERGKSDKPFHTLDAGNYTPDDSEDDGYCD